MHDYSTDRSPRGPKITSSDVASVAELAEAMLEYLDDWGATNSECFARRWFQKRLKGLVRTFVASNRNAVRTAMDDGEIAEDAFDDIVDEEV